MLAIMEVILGVIWAPLIPLTSQEECTLVGEYSLTFNNDSDHGKIETAWIHVCLSVLSEERHDSNLQGTILASIDYETDCCNVVTQCLSFKKEKKQKFVWCVLLRHLTCIVVDVIFSCRAASVYNTIVVLYIHQHSSDVLWRDVWLCNKSKNSRA